MWACDLAKLKHNKTKEIFSFTFNLLGKVGDTDRDIRGSEEELSVEIGFFYGVHVSHNDFAIPTSQSNHSKVFQQLTANGTSSHLKKKIQFKH